MAEFDFKPTFDVSWDTPKKEAPPVPQPVAQPQPKAVIETFGVENAFIDFKPSFETSVEAVDVKMPDPVPPIETLQGTVAAQIFGAYCQNKFGFKLDLSKE